MTHLLKLNPGVTYLKVADAGSSSLHLNDEPTLHVHLSVCDIKMKKIIWAQKQLIHASNDLDLDLYSNKITLD